MSRKVYVDVTVCLIINADDDQNVNEVLENMDYSFTASNDDDADIVETEIIGWDIKDSK